jgi:phosphoribosylanthranilate isomerase
MAKVKICGITTEVALTHAVETGADFVGLVHFEKSPRHLELDKASCLAKAARRLGSARSVVLLVDPDDDLVDSVVRDVAPDIIQLHGCESPQRAADIRRRSNRPVWKAVAVATAEDVSGALAYLEPAGADLLLFDARPPKGAALPGGNGLAFDWTILKNERQRRPFALAGGLTPENVAAAIELTGASIVDVSSGVEASPGQKDPSLVERFIAAAKPMRQTGSERFR